MRRIALGIILMLPMLETPALAHRGNFIGAGSTAQGDYLRGIGIASWGQGLYNLNTAQATSILVDADIRMESYLGAVFAAEREQYKRLLNERIAKEKRNYEAIKDRIRDHPERYDVFMGTALNAAFEQMNDPSIQEASLNSVQARPAWPDLLAPEAHGARQGEMASGIPGRQVPSRPQGLRASDR
jgi:hypothetical protein